MTLHPQTRAALEAEPAVRFSPDTLDECRASIRETAATDAGPGAAVAVVEDLSADGVPCRLYHPRPGEGLPVVVYLHGGGWVMGDLDTHDAVCRRVADRSGRAVLSVGYRLAPEFPWPAAIHDVEAAVAWLRRNAVGCGVDATHLGIVGDSAGGHVAAVVARRARDAGLGFGCQVLVYPVIDPGMATASYPAYAEYGLDREEMGFYWDAFCPAGIDRTQPDVSLMAAELRGLPSTLVITAEYDVLRDEGEAYATALAEAGVPAVLVRYQGVNHGFFRRLAVFDAAALAVDQVAVTLREGLPGGRD